MTSREFFVAVADANVSDELTAKANELIAALDAKNEKRKSSDSKEKLEAAARVEAVRTFLSAHAGNTFTRDEIAEAGNMTPAQVTAACKKLLADETIVKTEAKIDKSRKVVYTFPA